MTLAKALFMDHVPSRFVHVGNGQTQEINGSYDESLGELIVSCVDAQPINVGDTILVNGKEMLVSQLAFHKAVTRFLLQKKSPTIG